MRGILALLLAVLVGGAAVAGPPVFPVPVDPLGRVTRSITVPSALGWDQANYPVSLTLTSASGQPSIAAASLDPFSGSAATAARNGARYYVSILGSDSNGCTSTTSPCASIDKAVQLANAGGAPAHITLMRANTSGYFGRTNSAFGATKPTVDLYFDTTVATGGRVTLETFDVGYSWTVNSTYSNVWQITRSVVLRVVDPQRLDRFGLYSEYLRTPSLALCAQQPGSFYSDGTNLYLNPFPGEGTPSDQTARPYLNVNLWNWTPSGGVSPVNLFVDSIDFEGGAGSNLQIIVGSPTSGAWSNKILAIRNSSFRYGGGSSANSGALYINGWPGLVYIANSDAGASWSDLYNLHNSIPAAASLYALTINNTGEDAGRGPGPASWTGSISGTTLTISSYLTGSPHVGDTVTGTGVTSGTTLVAPNGANTWQVSASQTVASTTMSQAGVVSNNGLTAHDSALVAIDGAGVYQGAKGRTVHFIGSSKLLAFGTASYGSLGDIGQGGAFSPTEFSGGDSAQLWLDSVDPRPTSSAGQAILAPDTSTIFYRNLPSIRGSVGTAGSGQLVAY